MKKRIFCLILFTCFIIFTSLFVIFKTKLKDNNLTEFKNPIKIVYITDNNYVIYLRTSIRSVIANKKPETEIDINVIGVNLWKQNIDKILKESKKNVHIKIINISGKELNHLEGGTKTNPKVSRADNAKFFLPSILKNTDKVIYLDGDTIILKDLSDLYNINLNDNYVGAADDWQTKWDDKPYERYFNNGVMLLNLKKIKEDNLEDKLISFKINDKVKRFVTQDAFNNTMHNKTTFLPLMYNTFAPEYESNDIIKRIKEVLEKNYNPKQYPYKSNKEFIKDIVIIHYCGYKNKKPWNGFNLNRKTNRIWYRYAPIDFWLECIQGNCKEM